ncbi:MAG: RidA family protein [bacterium]|nr:RidA family protein [bacterium]
MSETRSRREAMAAVALGLGGASSAQAAEHWQPKKEKVGGPVRSGHLLFLSGIGGWYPNRRPEGPGDVKQQTRDALTIMKGALEKAGTSMANVLKVQVSLVDPEQNWPGMNEVYNEFFPDPRPVRSYFGATGFRRPGQLLQIDCIAYID